MYSLIIHLVIFIWRNIWLRHIALFAIGLALFFLGSGLSKEASAYKDGPQTVDAATLSEKNLEYDYLSLTGLTDGFHYISYVAPENATGENDVDLEKEIVLYYALLDQKQYDRSLNGDQSKPAVLVRQILPKDTDRACAETDEGCLTAGELSLTGKLMTTLPKEEDADLFAKVADEGNYATNTKTLYFDADWKPAAVSSAGFTRYGSWLWIALTAISLPLTVSRRRKKAELAMQASQAQPVQQSVQEDSSTPMM
jgi:hypothetical protein